MNTCNMLPDVMFLHVTSGRANVTSGMVDKPNVTLAQLDVTLVLPDITCKNITSGNMSHEHRLTSGRANVTLVQLTHHTRCNIGPARCNM